MKQRIGHRHFLTKAALGLMVLLGASWAHAQASAPMDPKRLEAALPKTLAGYKAGKPEAELRSNGVGKSAIASITFTDVRGGSQYPHITVRFSSEGEYLARMYKQTADYLQKDIKAADEQSFMWGSRRAIITQIYKDNWEAHTLVADKYVASVHCGLGLQGCLKLIQGVSLEDLAAVK